MRFLLLSAALAVTAAAQSIPRDGFNLYYRTVGKGPLIVLLSGGPGFDVDGMSGVAEGPRLTQVRIPRDPDQRSELMSITVPK